MWNGYDARLVDSDGAQKNGIEKVRAEMAGRGVLLDVARWAGVDFLKMASLYLQTTLMNALNLKMSISNKAILLLFVQAKWNSD